MPRKRKSHEFEDRQLGDLTDDISRERGELGPKRAARPPLRRAPMPPDMAISARMRKDETETGIEGTISQGADVRAVFDTRPINARDFIHTNTFNVPAGA